VTTSPLRARYESGTLNWPRFRQIQVSSGQLMANSSAYRRALGTNGIIPPDGAFGISLMVPPSTLPSGCMKLAPPLY
jgi:hypothetical protein